MNDFRFALRVLRKSPGFTLAVVLVLALGIGATTAIFSVVDQVLLRDLPFPEAGRLYMLKETDAGGSTASTPQRLAMYLRENRVFEDIGAAWGGTVALSGVGEPRQLDVEYSSAKLFPILGVRPILGRTFFEEEDRPGAEPVVVLGERVWRETFGGDPGVLGKTLALDEQAYRVIGVMPTSFSGPLLRGGSRIWLPISRQALKARNLYGRLRRDTSPAQAQAAMTVIAKPLGLGMRVESLHEQIVGDSRPEFLMLMAAVALVLLIACADVANLLLSRSTRRAREMMVRAAIGASRARLIRLSLTESLVLALAGGLAGVWLASAIPLSVLLMGLRAPQVHSVVLDLRVLGFALAASLATALLCGLLPALQASRVDLTGGLKEGATHASGGRRSNRTRGALIVTEIALALTLVAGAATMIHSFLLVRPAHPGFDVENRLVLTLLLRKNHYEKPEQQSEFARRAVERLESLPGVQHAAVSSTLPISGMAGILSVVPKEAGAQPVRVRYQSVSGEYFTTTGTPLLRGRPFDRGDRASSNQVAIVNEAFGKKFFGNPSPLGRTVTFQFFDKSKVECTIVGVAADVKLDVEAVSDRPLVFLPFDQQPAGYMEIVLSAAVPPTSLAAAARRELTALDPTQPVRETRTMRQVIAERASWATDRTLLMSLMAALALLLAAMGIYAVMACSIAERTREIGIRVALGARRADVLGMVARQGLAQLALGLALGLLGAWGATKLLVKYFFHVYPVGAGTFALAVAGLIVVAVVATLVPARRALGVDPMVALRYE